MRALAILGEVARALHPAIGSFDLSGCENLAEAVISIITRHPMREDELKRTLEQIALDQAGPVLAELEQSGRSQIVERYGVRFWSVAPAHYSTKTQSASATPGSESSRRVDVIEPKN